jgi:hypothetical protein
MTGKGRAATKWLKGLLAEAHPPGATMAVTGEQNSTRRALSKATTGKGVTTFFKSNKTFALKNFQRTTEGVIHPSFLL